MRINLFVGETIQVMESHDDSPFRCESESDLDMFFSKPSLICPNCMAMMNEITELRMELGRREENERKLKKNFTIAPTLYTFYKDRLAKRQLIR